MCHAGSAQGSVLPNDSALCSPVNADMVEMVSRFRMPKGLLRSQVRLFLEYKCHPRPSSRGTRLEAEACSSQSSGDMPAPAASTLSRVSGRMALNLIERLSLYPLQRCNKCVCLVSSKGVIEFDPLAGVRLILGCLHNRHHDVI